MFFVRLVVVLILLATLVVGLGFLLADRWTATRGALFDEQPPRIYEIVSNVEQFPAWRSDLKNLQIVRRGDLWAWTEDLSSGTTLYVEEVAKKPNERYELKYESSRGIRGAWVAEFKPSGEGRTTMTITETVFVENPLLRVGAHALLNLDALLDAYYSDLNRAVIQPDPSKAPPPKPTASGTAETPPTATPAPSGTVPTGTAPSATESPK